MDQEEYDALNTRAAFYSKIKNEREKNNTPAKLNTRTNNTCYLKCELHCGNVKWSKENELCENCLLFSQSEFPNGKLPTAENVINYFLYLQNFTESQKYVKGWTAVKQNVTADLILH